MLINKWSGPAGVMVLLGAIVWGVQLNIGMLKLVDEIGQLKEENIQQRLDQTTLANDVVRTAAILQSVANQLDNLEQRMTRNEGWISDNRANAHEHSTP